ncbi:MAG TPA: PQQ-dependent sugar dehydrogenase [Candidatus Saccharimonadales bacterium]|nr:PQQ-dependent sugar dehydrogenase [Candidatus Saccharimonadales bacterium]
MSPAPRRLPILTLILLAALAACGGPTTSPGRTDPASEAPASASPRATPGPTADASDEPHPSADAAPTLALEPVASGLDAPLDIAWRPSAPDDLFIAEQVGRVQLVRDGAVGDRPVLDIAGLVTAGGERGLLGLAFHPDPEDRRFFVYYTALDGAQVLASYELDANEEDVADPDSGRILLRMEDRFGNHNGGSLTFGPDGFLYVGTGDGGGGGDPLGSGQSLETLLAKVLRLDVDIPADGDDPYGIPEDNPFAGQAGARPEIFHTGLRNPWRIRFDRETDDLWIGDVGQNAWEEIDVARAGASGVDFGWNVMEATHCYEPETGCDPTGLTLPIAEYGHDEGCSVTGGTVYRGPSQAALVGWYVFSDYCSGRVWVTPADGDETREASVALDSGRSVSAIAEDAQGELYATDLSSGELLRFVVAD